MTRVPIDRDALTKRESERLLTGCLLTALLLTPCVIWLALRAYGQGGANSAESATNEQNRLATSWQDVFRAAIADPATSETKRDLFRQALAHEAEVETFTATVVFYHPKEAGSNWRKWARTRTGELVRPGVASCTVAHWKTWGGAWLHFEGIGLHKVRDNFPESRSHTMFDLAVPEAYPGQPYELWLADPSRVRFARNIRMRVRVVTVKPRGGWER